MIDAAVCPVCNADLSATDRGPTCGQRSCKIEMLMGQMRAKKPVLEREWDQTAASHADRLGYADKIVARVPFLTRTIAPTSADEKRKFRANLRRAIREAVPRLAKIDSPVAGSVNETEASPVLNASCITCRGYCCRTGAGHAFLQGANLEEPMRKRRTDSPSAIYRDYVRRIPTESYEESCVYHGRQGCALPRQMRASICNSFECPERRAFRAKLAASPKASAVVVAMDRADIRATAIAEPDRAIRFIGDAAQSS